MYRDVWRQIFSRNIYYCKLIYIITQLEGILEDLTSFCGLKNDVIDTCDIRKLYHPLVEPMYTSDYEIKLADEYNVLYGLPLCFFEHH